MLSKILTQNAQGKKVLKRETVQTQHYIVNIKNINSSNFFKYNPDPQHFTLNPRQKPTPPLIVHCWSWHCFFNYYLCLYSPFTALVDAIVRKETDEIRNILESEDVDING